MNYSFLPLAEAEYLEAVAFYEARSAGLGAALIAEFGQVMQRICERPGSWKLVHPTGVHCLSLKRFPYAVFYRALADGPQITAFAHHRRRPGYWLMRT